jgi:hypothetical protein
MDNVPVNSSRVAPTGRNIGDVNTHSVDSRGKQKKNKFKLAALIIGGVTVLAIILLISLYFYRSSTGATIDGSKYQAVFFTNGQVYFGKLQTLNSGYLKLNDIYYLQTKTAATDSTNPQATGTEANPGVELVKLGNEVHGPDDEMIVSKDQILFFENLKKDGKVTQSIASFQNKK